MSQGQPLTNNDRWDWLISLREAATNRLSPSKSSAIKAHDGGVVTCSALKRRYSDVIKIAAYNDNDVMEKTKPLPKLGTNLTLVLENTDPPLREN